MSLVVRVRIGTASDGRVVALPLEDYVVGAVLGEVALGALPPSTARSVAELQAILARTYAVTHRGRHQAEGFDLCATTHCQLYRAEPRVSRELSTLVHHAVDATKGLVITYRGRPIEAVYHADCGGYTSAAAMVWGHQPVPYLVARADPYCRRQPAPDWRFEMSAGDLGRRLALDPRTAVGPVLRRIRILERDRAGRVVRVALEGNGMRMVRGELLREMLGRGALTPPLRSTRFTVRRRGDSFVFVGRGAGHGVGLCQAGALARIAAGVSLQSVLRHYYPGTSIAPLNAAIRTTRP